MNNRAEEYRRLAQECMELVATVATEKTRDVLLHMARVWSRLADEQTANQVVTQQQQQQQ